MRAISGGWSFIQRLPRLKPRLGVGVQRGAWDPASASEGLGRPLSFPNNLLTPRGTRPLGFITFSRHRRRLPSKWSRSTGILGSLTRVGPALPGPPLSPTAPGPRGVLAQEPCPQAGGGVSEMPRLSPLPVSCHPPVLPLFLQVSPLPPTPPQAPRLSKPRPSSRPIRSLQTALDARIRGVCQSPQLSLRNTQSA